MTVSRRASKIINTLVPIWFFLCFEYQALFSEHQYSLITAAGLAVLLIAKFVASPQGASTKSLFGKATVRKGSLGLYEKLAAGTYATALILGMIFGAGIALQLAFMMITAIMGVTFFSLKQSRKIETKAQEEKVVSQNLTFTTNFLLPVVILCLANFLLSAQIDFTFAFQSINIVSTIVLADMLAKENKWTELLEKKEISEDEFKHLLFYRWSRYWNFFLGVWYFISLQQNGVINNMQSYILIFAFSVLYFLFLIREVAVLKFRELFTVIVFALILTALDPLAMKFFGTDIASYWVSALLFVAFDVGNIYFFQSHVETVGRSFWAHKSLLYIVATLYIVQVHIMMTNPNFSLESIYSKFFFEKNASEIYTSVLHTPEPSPPTIITPDDGSSTSR